MKFTLLVVGRTVEKHYITAIDDYVARTKHFTQFDMEVIPELKNTKSLSMEQQKEKEADLILKALGPGDTVVLLDEHGDELRSIEFAQWMRKRMVSGLKRLVFVIGGPYGFSEEVYATLQESHYAKDKCDVKIGECSCKGDLKHYDVVFKGKTMSATLSLDGTIRAWRSQTGSIFFGDVAKYPGSNMHNSYLSLFAMFYFYFSPHIQSPKFWVSSIICRP